MYVNVTAIITHNNQALIIQRSLDNEYFPGVWAAPGGGMENFDLTIEDAAKREVLEELGIDVNIGPVVQNDYNVDDDVLYLKMSATLTEESDYNRNLVFSDEVNDYKWVDKSDLKNYEFTPLTVEVIESLLA